jgi:hypothetical protein
VSDDGPNSLPPSWTYALGGPAPEPVPEDQDDEDPPLEPAVESDTLRRLRERTKILNARRAYNRHQH